MLVIRARNCWMVVSAALVATSVGAADIPLPKAGVEQITSDRWRTILTEVQSTAGVDCETISNTRLYLCHRMDRLFQEEMWAFAMEGSPAFPAVSHAVLRRRACLDYSPGSLDVRLYLGPMFTIDRSGEYAGDRAAFDGMMKKLFLADQKFLRQQKVCLNGISKPPTAAAP